MVLSLSVETAAANASKLSMYRWTSSSECTTESVHVSIFAHGDLNTPRFCCMSHARYVIRSSMPIVSRYSRTSRDEYVTEPFAPIPVT